MVWTRNDTLLSKEDESSAVAREAEKFFFKEGLHGEEKSPMWIACLDLEGVLIPEIWVSLAARTGIVALARTTRDNPDFGDLMGQRMALLDTHGLKLADIQAVVAEMSPLDGAPAFLDWLRARAQVVLLSDIFYELTAPLMRQLGYPTLLCHHLECDEQGRVSAYRLRQPHAKRQAVRAFQGLNFRVVAVGDSYNDAEMLAQADAGIMFRPPDRMVREFPDFAVARDYDELRRRIDGSCE